jgi:hypothetical protein
MPLKLKQPPPDDVADVVPLEQELTQGAIDRFHAQLDAYIDAFVAEQKRQMPNQPIESLRHDLLKGGCRCKAAARLLREQQT